MRIADYTLTEGNKLDAQLGASAHSVIIDNYSASWAQLGTTGRSIPPFTTGAIYPLDGTQRAQLTWQAPSSFIQPPPSGGILLLSYVSEVLPYTAGNTASAGPGGTSPQQLITTITSRVGPGFIYYPENSATPVNGVGYTLPAGTQAIAVVLGVDPAPAGSVINALVYDTRVNINTASPSILWGRLDYDWTFPAQKILIATVQPSYDNKIKIALNESTAAGRTVSVIAIRSNTFMDVTDRFERQLGHVVVDGLSSVDVSNNAGRLLGHVSVDNVNIATKETAVSSLTPAAFYLTPPAGTSSVVISAIGGKTITIYGYTWHVTAISPIGLYLASLQDSAGTNIVDYCSLYLSSLAGVQASPSHSLWIPGGYALGVGLGARVLNSAGSAGITSAIGTVWYTQL